MSKFYAIMARCFDIATSPFDHCRRAIDAYNAYVHIALHQVQDCQTRAAADLQHATMRGHFQ